MVHVVSIDDHARDRMRGRGAVDGNAKRVSVGGVVTNVMDVVFPNLDVIGFAGDEDSHWNTVSSRGFVIPNFESPDDDVVAICEVKKTSRIARRNKRGAVDDRLLVGVIAEGDKTCRFR